MHPFTALFLAAFALSIGLRLILAYRQYRHVLAHRERVPAPFADQVSLDAHRKAADYTCAKTRLGCVAILVDGLILIVLTLGGGLDLGHEIASKFFASDIVRGIALVALVAIATSVVELPLSLYRTFRLEARFGFNKMTLKLFFLDLSKGAVLAVLLGGPLLALILWLMAVAGERWWLYAWAAWSGFNLLLLAIYPTFIAPMFNKFSPMQDEALAARIERLLERCGFRSQGLFVMDGSKRSSHGNAYFTGFGQSKRIVFFDTLLARLDPPEIEAVLAHELGHFKRRHVIKRMVWLFAAALGFFWLLGQMMQQPWFYSALGVETPSTAMALVLFFLVLPVFTFLLQPLFGIYSRKHEFEADHYATQHASAKDLETALVKLYKDNASTLTPDPWHSAFYDSHPPASTRIARLQQSLASG
jgi:STE24 endopeptidase